MVCREVGKCAFKIQIRRGDLRVAELHAVHPSVGVRPADVDGQSFYLRLRLLERRHHSRIVQAVFITTRTGAGCE